MVVVAFISAFKDVGESFSALDFAGPDVYFSNNILSNIIRAVPCMMHIGLCKYNTNN